jgi:hypothetical protein
MHTMHERVERGEMQVNGASTPDMVADFSTKALISPKHARVFGQLKVG